MSLRVERGNLLLLFDDGCEVATSFHSSQCLVVFVTPGNDDLEGHHVLTALLAMTDKLVRVFNLNLIAI